MFADPPYFGAHSGAAISRTDNSPSFIRQKATWAAPRKVQHQYEFHMNWLSEAQRVLKVGGTIWVSTTYHAMGALAFAMQSLRFHMLNEIILVKRNAPPNFKGTCFRALTESMIWAKKDKRGKKLFNYWQLKAANGGKQMNNVWEYVAKKQPFRHPATKQSEIIEKVLAASANRNSIVLDPFSGSGTTHYVAKSMGIQSIGFEIEESSCKIIKERLSGKYGSYEPKIDMTLTRPSKQLS